MYQLPSLATAPKIVRVAGTRPDGARSRAAQMRRCVVNECRIDVDLPQSRALLRDLSAESLRAYTAHARVKNYDAQALYRYAEAGENVDRRTDAGDGRTDKGARTDARTKAAPRTGASAARDPRAGPWARAAGALATMLPARSRAGCCRRGVTPTRVEPASAVSASAMVAGLPCHRSTARQRSGCGWACRRLGMSTVGHAMASI